MANITLVGLHLKRSARLYQRSHVAVDGSELSIAITTVATYSVLQSHS